MWGVPPALRPFAVSMSVVAIHVLGDVPSPPLLGALQGWVQNWRLRCGVGGKQESACKLRGGAGSVVGPCCASEGAKGVMADRQHQCSRLLCCCTLQLPSSLCRPPPPAAHPPHTTPLPCCSMSVASALLLVGAAAYFVAALVSVTAIDYRELVAAAQAEEGGEGSGTGGSSAGLLAAARAAMAAEDGTQHGLQLDDAEGDEGGLGLGSRPTSPDRPLLGPGARS